VSCIAADIGGTKIAVGRVDGDGRLLGDIATAPTPWQGGVALLATVIELATRIRHPDDDRIGVSSAGVIDSANGTVRSATSSIASWAGAQVRSVLQEATGLPVTVLGDGHAAGLGQAVYGLGKGKRTVVVLAVGTGIGGALVIDGQPQLGAGGAAGHFGHMAVPEATGVACSCGGEGHAEAVGGGAGILETYRSAGGSPLVTSTSQLAARNDDPIAVDALRRGGRALGTLAGGLASALDPDLIAVSGGVAAAGADWWTAVEQAFRASALPALVDTPLVRTEAGPATALRGAAYFAHRGNA
jgi:glucokinase